MKIHKIRGDKLVSIQTYHEATPSNGVKRFVLPMVLQEQDVYYVGWFVAMYEEAYSYEGEYLAVGLEYAKGEDISYKSFYQFQLIIQNDPSMKIFRSSGALMVYGRDYNVCQLAIKLDSCTWIHFHAFISEGVTKLIAEATYMRFYLGI